MKKVALAFQCHRVLHCTINKGKVCYTDINCIMCRLYWDICKVNFGVFRLKNLMMIMCLLNLPLHHLDGCEGAELRSAQNYRTEKKMEALVIRSEKPGESELTHFGDYSPFDCASNP